MKLRLRKDGYYQLGLSNKGQRKNVLVHRLVAIAFLPNPNNFPVVNHIDGVKTNDRVENLEWCSTSDNLKHAYKTGLKTKRFPKEAWEKSMEAIKRPVEQYTLEGTFVRAWDSIVDAGRETNTNPSTISHVCKRLLNTAGGYLWRYSDDVYGIEQALAKLKSWHGKQPVFQFDLRGKFLKWWPSAQDIQRETNWKASSIALCCQGKIAQAYGFIWARGLDIDDRLNSGKLEKARRKNIPINQYDTNVVFIKSWPSATIAGQKLGTDPSSILKVCRGKQKHANGFVWRYVDSQ